MTLPDLIKSAETDLTGLCLLFARDIAGHKNAVKGDYGEILHGWQNTLKAQRFQSDFSAVFQAAKDKGIWAGATYMMRAKAFYVENMPVRFEQCDHRPEWDETPCVPLMICILAVWYAMEKKQA